MKKIFLLLCCLHVTTPIFGDFIWDMKTAEQRAQWTATKAAFMRGDLGPIHEAYVKRDLKLLWKIVQRPGAFDLSPEAEAQLENPSEVEITIYKTVIDYTRRLLSQIPGHAKFIGDEIDAIAGERDRITQIGRETYLHTLAELGSEESIHEIGRFIGDPRGIPTAEDVEQDKKALAEKRYADRGKYGVGSAYAVDWDARNALWDARVGFPFRKDPRNKLKAGLNHTRESQKEVDDWWASAASAKYRQPLDLTGQPPEEPPPARFDTKAIYKKAKDAEKPQATVHPPKPANPPPSPAPKTVEEKPLSEAEEREAWDAMIKAAGTGNLSPIYEAYRKCDLKFLWKTFDAGTHHSIELGKEEAAQVENTREVNFTISKAVARYAQFLLKQIPGHAKFLGDKIDLIAADLRRDV